MRITLELDGLPVENLHELLGVLTDSYFGGFVDCELYRCEECPHEKTCTSIHEAGIAVYRKVRELESEVQA